MLLMARQKCLLLELALAALYYVVQRMSVDSLISS